MVNLKNMSLRSNLKKQTIKPKKKTDSRKRPRMTNSYVKE